jgi:hypothetical protein
VVVVGLREKRREKREKRGKRPTVGYLYKLERRDEQV